MRDEIERVKRNSDCHVISLAAIHDPGVSWKAAALYCYLASRPEGWRFTLRDLVGCHTDGISAVRSGLRELRATGYLRSESPHG